MRIIVAADSHLGKFWKINNSRSNRAEKVFRSFVENLEKMGDRNTDVVVAGDLFDSVHPNLEMLLHFKPVLEKTVSGCRNSFVIAGNHETFVNKRGEQQSILDLALFSAEFFSRGISSRVVDNCNLIFVPFQMNVLDVMEREIPGIYKREMTNILVAHETPKEIFSYGKISLAPLIESLEKQGVKIPLVILGDYHKPRMIKIMDTTIVSVGSTYYHTIDDVRDQFGGLKKRVLLLSDQEESGGQRILEIHGMKVYSVDCNLPDIFEVSVENQEEFNSRLDWMLKKYSENNMSTFWLKSPSLINYEKAVYEGCDIYYDQVKNPEKTMEILSEMSEVQIDDVVSGKTLEERWGRYLDTSKSITETERQLADFLFSRRNDLSLDGKEILKFMGVI